MVYQVRQSALGSTYVYQSVPEPTKVYQSVPECTKVYQSVSECIVSEVFEVFERLFSSYVLRQVKSLKYWRRLKYFDYFSVYILALKTIKTTL